MIKTENGSVRGEGTNPQLYADLGVIIRTLVEQDIVTQEEVHDLANIATMTNEEIDQYFENKMNEERIRIDTSEDPEEPDNEEGKDFIEILEILNRMISRRLK